MSGKYTRAEIENLIEQNQVAETTKLKSYLIEAFSVLPKDIVDRCIKNISFQEMDRWGEYLPNDFEPIIKLKKCVIRISQETLRLDPKIAKFIFLYRTNSGLQPSFPV